MLGSFFLFGTCVIIKRKVRLSLRRTRTLPAVSVSPCCRCGCVWVATVGFICPFVSSASVLLSLFSRSYATDRGNQELGQSVALAVPRAPSLLHSVCLCRLSGPHANTCAASCRTSGVVCFRTVSPYAQQRVYERFTTAVAVRQFVLESCCPTVMQSVGMVSQISSGKYQSRMHRLLGLFLTVRWSSRMM